jgi:hypothetical protein
VGRLKKTRKETKGERIQMVVPMRSIAIAAAVICGLAASENLSAACSSTIIAYQASGEFGPNPISGQDTLKLAGEPFSITLYACETLTPTKVGSDYSEYYPIEMKGQVKSSLLVQPYQISAKTAFILQVPPTGLDAAELQGDVTVEGRTIFIKGDLSLPSGTLTSRSIAPFSKVTIDTAKSEFIYTEMSPAWAASTAYAVNAEIMDPAGNTQEATVAGTSGTTAPVWNETVGGTTTDGTVTWTCKGVLSTALSVIGTAAGNVYTPPADKADAMLFTNGVQVIAAHVDGTESVRPLEGAPVDPAASLDRVLLQFYASGVRDASEIHVQIAGQNVPVLYAGASGPFPGLDEVTVEVPRSLAGMGDADVAMTADGQSASPVRIHIQ